MFSSGSANFKGLRRKVKNDGSSSSAVHMARPSTSSSTERNYKPSITDLLEPALDGPPSPEGIRAFSRRMKQRSFTEQQTIERATSSGSSSSRSETRETSWERGLENFGLSRNPSQRASAMASKERPDSVFGKTVFGRKLKLRREQSDQSAPNSSLLSLTEIPADSAPDVPKEQRFIQSMFTRRRPRGVSEVSQKKIQISGPYGFQHVAHTAKKSLTALDQAIPNNLAPSLPSVSPRMTTSESNPPESLNSSALNKPLPTPPSPQQDLERFSWQASIQSSPPRSPRVVHDTAQTAPILPPPRTSSCISVHHDRTDSVGSTTLEKSRTNSGSHQIQSFILPLTNGLGSSPIARGPYGNSDQGIVGGIEESSHIVPTTDDPAWPFTGSMTSLPEVPEEEEYYLATIPSRMSVTRDTTSLRGSVSVPHLRRVSLSQATQRPPSNASDTLGRFDLLAAQRALRESDEEDIDADDLFRDCWEDDIDYCYDHEAEADCDFAWERPSCDLERDNYYTAGVASSHGVESSRSSFGLASEGLLPTITTDFPGLRPTSFESKTSQYEATTPTSSTVPVASNFSLPRIGSSNQLKRDYDRSHSSSSSFQEVQGFCLSPSLLIPNDYHEKLLEYERDELSIHASGDEFNLSQHDDQYLNFDKPAIFSQARSSASTTMSIQSLSSSRHQSSTSSSSAFTRWTDSSSSSWQMYVDPSQQPVAITLNDEKPITSEVAVMRPDDSPTFSLGHSRAQSEATSHMKALHDTAAPLQPKISKESLKAHRRARTSSRSHPNASPQLALFPQVPQRF